MSWEREVESLRERQRAGAVAAEGEALKEDDMVAVVG
jgi:hypothetical protein